MRFKDKVAIITGAASGIALLCAQKYAEEGGRVCLVDINQEGVTAAAAGIRAKGRHAFDLRCARCSAKGRSGRRNGLRGRSNKGTCFWKAEGQQNYWL